MTPTAQPTPCILASGPQTKQGYVFVYVREEKRQYLAHRLAWIREKGPIPKGMYVCHRCDNPPCRNVDHLFLGTPADNMRDAMSKHRIAPKILCKRGHNEWTTHANGTRRCKACHRADQNRLRHG